LDANGCLPASEKAEENVPISNQELYKLIDDGGVTSESDCGRVTEAEIKEILTQPLIPENAR